MVGEVLYISSPENVGGLGFTPRQMSLLYTLRPIHSTLINLYTYPTLAKRFAPEKILRWLVTLNSTTYSILMFIYGMFAFVHHPSHILSIAVLWIFAISFGFTACTYSACTQTLQGRVPDKRYLARLTTAQEYAGNLGHSLGAFIGSNVSAISVTHDIFHGQLLWLFTVSLACTLATLASRIPQAKVPT